MFMTANENEKMLGRRFVIVIGRGRTTLAKFANHLDFKNFIYFLVIMTAAV